MGWHCSLECLHVPCSFNRGKESGEKQAGLWPELISRLVGSGGAAGLHMCFFFWSQPWVGVQQVGVGGSWEVQLGG